MFDSDYDIEKELKNITINYRRFMRLDDLCDDEINTTDRRMSDQQEEKMLDDKDRAYDMNNI